jgi:hypothetical protein
VNARPHSYTTRSAWLVNLLARDSEAMQRLSALGRRLRDAQTGLSHAELRSLAEQRRHLISELLDQAQAHAADADLRLTPAVLLEVESDTAAASIAGALTIPQRPPRAAAFHAGWAARRRSKDYTVRRSSLRATSAGPGRDVPHSVADELAAGGDEVQRLNGPSRLSRDLTRHGSAGTSATEADETAPATEAERQTRRDLLKVEEDCRRRGPHTGGRVRTRRCRSGW